MGFVRPESRVRGSTCTHKDVQTKYKLSWCEDSCHKCIHAFSVHVHTSMRITSLHSSQLTISTQACIHAV